MKHTFIECSDQGKIRNQNEDSAGHAVNESIDAELFCVADGMGGYGAGDVASQSVVDSVIQEFMALEICESQSLDTLVSGFFSNAQQALCKTKSDRNITSMLGTTLAVLMIAQEQLVYANVGDSRIYSFDGTRLMQKSFDHTFVNDLLIKGIITEEQAKTHPKRHVLTQAITGENKKITPYVLVESVNNNHIYLICSDGLYNMVTDEFICNVLKRSSILKAENLLLKEAYANGARDNITFQIIRPFDGEETTL